MADWYTQSHPGNDCYANNCAVTSAIRQLRKPECKPGPLSDREIERLTSTLNYRTSMTKLATSYKNHLGIKFEDCQDMDASEEHSRVKYTIGIRSQAYAHLRKCWDLVCGYDNGLFDEPRGSQGLPYGQLTPYTTIVLYSTNWTDDEMKTAITKCVRYKAEDALQHHVSVIDTMSCSSRVDTIDQGKEMA